MILFRMWIRSTVEKMWMKLAWAMPRMLVYWCAIRLIGHATSGEWGNRSPSDLLAMDALQRWER